jgi:glycosyltransferase involved in cell wall biosynthesis
MKITLITHYYPPEVNAPANRAAAHARLWTDLGHTVTIVTAQPSHPYGKLYPNYDNVFSDTVEEGIRIVRLKTKLGANKGFRSRISNYVSFMMAVRAARKTIGPQDVVVSTSPQFFAGYSGQFVSKTAQCPWVLEIRDVWPDSIGAVGVSFSGLISAFLSALVKRAYKKADKIVSVSPGFDDHFRDYGVPPEKVVLLPNGVDKSVKTGTFKSDEWPALDALSGRTLFAYVGTLGMAHDVMTIVRAAERLKDRADIGFLIIGSGAEADKVSKALAETSLENIVMLDQQPRTKILDLFDRIDVSLIHLRRQDVFKTVIPTKMLEAMALETPILMGVEGTAASILKDAGAGALFEPENAQALADQCVRFVDTLSQDGSLSKMSTSGRAYMLKHFERTAIGQKYEAFLRRLCEDAPSKPS